MKEFTITKVLTHNIVFSTLGTTDYVLIGKGIGFNKKPGNRVSENLVSTSYIVRDIAKITQYENIVLSTPADVVFATEKAIQLAEQLLNYTFGESLHISLLDHINFAIYRMENNLKIGSFLTQEYYLLYPELHEVAEKMVELINHKLNIILPEAEIGAIILHLHAGMKEEQLTKTIFYSEIIDFCLEFIGEKMPESADRNPINRARLITHLKFALKRNENNESLKGPITDTIVNNFPDSFQLAKELFAEVEAEFGKKLTESEIAYIALHIENLK